MGSPAAFLFLSFRARGGKGSCRAPPKVRNSSWRILALYGVFWSSSGCFISRFLVLALFSILRPATTKTPIFQIESDQSKFTRPAGSPGVFWGCFGPSFACKNAQNMPPTWPLNRLKLVKIEKKSEEKHPGEKIDQNHLCIVAERRVRKDVLGCFGTLSA